MPAEIVDVHIQSSDGDTFDIKQQIVDGLQRPTGEKHMPTMLLYDERGLRLYDDITTEVPEYYLFGAEEEILRNHSDEIVQAMHHGDGEVSMEEVVLELGAGYVCFCFNAPVLPALLMRLLPSHATLQGEPVTECLYNTGPCGRLPISSWDSLALSRLQAVHLQ